MIKVVAKNYVKPEEVEKFKEYAAELIKETLKEEGNISYNLYEDTNNKHILTFIEDWKDNDALDLHMNSVHFKKIVPELSKLQEKDMEINIYKSCY